MGSRSRSSSSQTTYNTNFSVGENSGLMFNGDGNSYRQDVVHDYSTTDNSVYTDSSTTDNSYTDNSYTDASYTDNSDNSFTDNSDNSFTDNSDNSFNDHSYTDNSFTDQSDNRFMDYSQTDNSYTDNSVINYIDGGAVAAAESISLNAMGLGTQAIDASAFVTTTALDNVSLLAGSAVNSVSDIARDSIQFNSGVSDRVIQAAELMSMENSNFLGGVAQDITDTFRNISATNAQLFSSMQSQSAAKDMENLRTIERAADAALTVAGNVSRSDDAMQTENVAKYFGLAIAAMGVAMAFRR